jgi:AcrR family transcriptional regulator
MLTYVKKMGRRQRSASLIVSSAEVAFRERGFANVSMEEIAQRAGLSRMTVYNLFEDKDDIVRAIVADADAKYEPAFRQRMAANEDALILLRDALRSSARWCLDNPSIAPIALAGTKDKAKTAQPPERPSFHRLIADLMILGQQQGTIRRDEDAYVSTMILLGVFAQALLYALSGGPFHEQSTDHLLRVIIEGLGTKQRRSAKPKAIRNAGRKSE